MPSVITNAAKETMIAAISGADLKIALLNNLVVSAADTDLKDFSNWNQLSAYEISGTGYTAGGVSLIGLSAYSNSSTDIAYFNGSSITWSTSTISAYGYTLYRSTSGLIVSIVQFNGVTDGNPKYSISGPFSISWNENKILQMIG